jgi:3-keto-5-aminohexanoate cleavage enzyme
VIKYQNHKREREHKMKPIIICAAVTGGGPPKSKTPYQPVTPEEIAEATVACWHAGAAMVHFHGRLKDGQTTTDVNAYKDIVGRVRAAGCDAILCLSAGDDGGHASHSDRLKVADVGTEIVSLDAGSFNTGNRLYDNSPSYLWEMAKRMQARGIKPEIEIFDIGNLDTVAMLVKEGLLTAPYYIQFLFNIAGGMPADTRLLPLLLERVPPGTEWFVGCNTRDHETFLRLTMSALVNGGHLRTGMEDHVYLRPDELAKTNTEMVEQWVETARVWGRPIASPTEARKILGLAVA